MGANISSVGKCISVCLSLLTIPFGSFRTRRLDMDLDLNCIAKVNAWNQF